MPVKKMKVNPGMKVVYKGFPVTVIKQVGIAGSKVEIRNRYGYPETVKLTELSTP